MDAKDRIIVALDVDDWIKAVKLTDKLRDLVGGFKIGLQLQRVLLTHLLTCKHEMSAGELLCMRYWFGFLDGKIMWDGKDHDIPNTMAGAAEQNAKLRVLAFTVHASAGLEGMRAAVENRGDSMVLAVTVLTSHDDRECRSIFGDCVEQKVGEFAQLAARAGVQGIVCSPADLPLLKRKPILPGATSLEGLEFWTPGIRPRWSVKDDQARITTPTDAIKAGATRLIIGRAITRPPEEIGSPADAARAITAEIEETLAG